MKKKTLVFLLAMLLIAALAFTGCAKDAANDGINDGVKDEQGLVGELEDDLDGDRDHDEKNDDKIGQDADKQNDKKQSGSKSEKVDDAAAASLPIKRKARQRSARINAMRYLQGLIDQLQSPETHKLTDITDTETPRWRKRTGAAFRFLSGALNVSNQYIPIRTAA